MEKNKFFDWETGGTVAVATVGQVATSFDTILARLIALLTVAILAIKLYRMLRKAKLSDPKEPD